MNTNHKQKPFDKLLKKSAKAVLTVFLAILAVVAGVQAGNLLYKLDFNIIKSIDPNNFKNLISLSIPIVESVYNSGKSSVSFSGEVKELFTKVFDFDLDSPASILNAQSPIFKSYYKVQSLKKSSMADNALSGQSIAPGGVNAGSQSAEGYTINNSNGGNGSSSGGTGNGSNGGDVAGNGTGDRNSGDGIETGNNNNGTESGNDEDDGAGNGTGNANETGNKTGNDSAGAGSNESNKDPSGDSLIAGQLDGTPESSMSIGTEYGFSYNSAITGQKSNSTGQNNNAGGVNNNSGGLNQGSQQQPGSQGGNNQPGQGVQPISSVALEIEDEKDGDEKETVELDKIQIKNFTKHKIDIAKLLKEPLNINLSKKGPKVLIYHTHTTESYVLKEADLGKKDVPSFSSNPKYSVVRVGEELTRNLEKYGIETLHNGTVHDKVHDAAYGASINTLQSYKKSYPSIQVYIDIHRDAVGSDQPKLRMTKEINGKNCAQIMFVVGADGMLPHPQWQENLKFVLKLQQKLNEKYPGLAKPVRIVGKRYNQQISNNAILIEVGGDGNLLGECIESTKYLAEVLNDVMKDK